jgi:hypothetical protein
MHGRVVWMWGEVGEVLGVTFEESGNFERSQEKNNV